MMIPKDSMYHKFCLYGFLKNLRFFDPFLVLFFREMGLSFLEIGALFSIREICTNLLEIPTGVVADACGRRKAMLASFGSYLLSFGLFYLFPRFSICVLAMVLFAFGETFRSGTHKAMILEYLRNRGISYLKVHYYGHTRAASQLGSAVAALLAAGLVFYVGSYRVVFLASLLPYVLALFLLASYPKELDGEITAIEGSWKLKLKKRLASTGGDFLHMLREPRLLRGLLNSGSFDAVFKSTKGYLQPIMQSQVLALPILLSFNEGQRVAVVVGALYFLIHVATSFAARNAGRVQRRAGSFASTVNLTYLVGAAFLVGAGAATWIGIYPLAVAAFLGLHLLQNIRRPMIVGCLSDMISHRTMATGLSVEAQLRTLLMAGLAPLIGLLADLLGIGVALITVALAAAAIFPLLQVRDEKPTPEEILRKAGGDR